MANKGTPIHVTGDPCVGQRVNVVYGGPAPDGQPNSRPCVYVGGDSVVFPVPPTWAEYAVVTPAPSGAALNAAAPAERFGYDASGQESETPARVMERAFMATVPERLQSPDAKATFDAWAAHCDELVNLSLSTENAAMAVTELTPLDRSDAADAARLRWMLNGHGYLLEEAGLCGHGPEDADKARRLIDEIMAEGE